MPVNGCLVLNTKDLYSVDFNFARFGDYRKPLAMPPELGFDQESGLSILCEHAPVMTGWIKKQRFYPKAQGKKIVADSGDLKSGTPVFSGGEGLTQASKRSC